MIRIEPEAWQVMVSHARSAFPNECCGVVFGVNEDGARIGKLAVPMENAYHGGQEDRYEIRNEDLLAADEKARKQGLELLAIFHSHPDCDAYFSATDLKHSCPWYSFVVLSIKNGEFDHANSYLPNAEQTAADKEELVY
jgi:proteasome lid subunit RPN8/RPN11